MTETEVQTEPATPPHRIEIEHADEYSRYLLHSKTEIIAVLRTLIQKVALITVHFNHGQSFLLTSMLSFSEGNDGFILDLGANDEMNQKALLAKRLILTAIVDKVKIQFNTENLMPTQYEGRPAFSARIPGTLLRLQRREFFRLSTPIAHPVNMSAVVRRADGSALNIEIPLFDISGGGVGLMVSPEIAQLFQRGDTLPECRINLPEEGMITTDLVIRNKFDVTTRTGSLFVRAGCEFVGIPPSRLNMVQRYITRVERERKARLSGLG